MKMLTYVEGHRVEKLLTLAFMVRELPSWLTWIPAIKRIQVVAAEARIAYRGGM